MRVAYLLDQFATPSAGTEQQFLALLRGLDRMRFHPGIYLLRGPDLLSALLPGTRVKVLGIGSLFRPGAIARAWQLGRELRRDGISVAHLFFNDSAVLFPFFLSMHGVRVVVARRDLGFWYTRGILSALRVQRRFVSRVVANSEAVATRVTEMEGYPLQRITVIPNGKESPRELFSITRAREKADLPDDARVLVVVANVKPLKRSGDIVRALPLIRSMYPRTLLVLVGADTRGVTGPSHLAELRTLAQSLGVDEALLARGAVADPSTLIFAADVCLLCSETEGLSNAVIEYMLAGKPVVCTRVGGNPELVEASGGGTLVEVGDPDGIAQAVNRYLGDPDLCSAHGKRGRAFAMEKFGMSAMLKAHEALYSSLHTEGGAARKENYVT